MPISWRQIQLQTFHSWEPLAKFLDWSDAQKQAILHRSSFPLNLPLRLAQKISKRTLDDPILKQFLPMPQEELAYPGFSPDPVQDASFRKDSKLIHKYQGRALLVASGACAMHCRYCFRRNFSYETARKDFAPELAIIANDPSLKEIILSGGDPLSLSNTDLAALLSSLDAIPHLRRIRFHTRFPIGIPERLDEEFLAILHRTQKQVIFVIHCNHAKELDEDIFFHLKQVHKMGIPLLSQTVLLKGVNDDSKTLAELFESLSDHGILPYYLHQLDRVKGAHHFEVTRSQGEQLMRELSTILSGYSLPKYVAEIPGEASKTILSYNTKK